MRTTDIKANVYAILVSVLFVLAMTLVLVQRNYIMRLHREKPIGFEPTPASTTTPRPLAGRTYTKTEFAQMKATLPTWRPEDYTRIYSTADKR